MKNNISRRHFVGSAAAALVLPNFFQTKKAIASTSATIPTRSVFIGMGYGVSPEWFPSEKEPGANYRLPELFAPIAKHRKDFSFIQNMSLKGPDPAKSAHMGSMYWLSDAASQEKVTLNQALPTCDQLAAKIVGGECRFPSLVLSGTGSSARNGHGPGIRSLSWNEGGQHMSGIIGPRKLYMQMYGSAGVTAAQIRTQLQRKKSILDSLVGEMKSLQLKLSKNDQQVLEQYGTSLREVELRLKRADKHSSKKKSLPHMDPPGEELTGTKAIKLTYDLITLAFQADLTRVATYMLPNQSLLGEIAPGASLHEMSHFRGTGKANHLKRDRTQLELLAYFFDKLKAVKEPDRQTLFDHTMIAYGSVLRNKHTRKNGPTLFAGYGGGGIKQGLNVVSRRNATPVTNLWFSMLRHLDRTQPGYHNSNNVISDVFRS